MKVNFWKKTKKNICLATVLSCIIGCNFATLFAGEDWIGVNFDLHCKGYFLVDIDTNQVMFAKDEHKRVEPASLAKIMTATLVLKNIPDIDNTKIVAKKNLLDEINSRNAKTASIVEKEEFTVRQLLEMTLISSACDAALILADAICPNNISLFVDMMNKQAQEIGAYNTHFVNPHGLHEYEKDGTSIDEHNAYSTAYDMYVITKYIMGSPVFKEIIASVQKQIPSTNKREAFNIVSTISPMIPGSSYYYEPIKGGKTGTEVGGRSLVSIASKNGKNYICCVLGSPFYVDETKPYNLYTDSNRETVKEYWHFIDTIAIYKLVFGNQ